MAEAKVVSLALYRARRAAEARRRLARMMLPNHVDAFNRRLWETSLDRLAQYLRQLTEETSMPKFEIEAPADEPILIMTRVLNGPRALVWKAWTEAEHFARWWGSHATTNKIIAFDFKPGGDWRVESTSEHGVFTFFGKFLAIEPQSRFVWTFGVAGMYEDPSEEEHNFSDHDGKTLLRTVSRFKTIAERDGMIVSMEGGADESMDRLEALLETLQ